MCTLPNVLVLCGWNTMLDSNSVVWEGSRSSALYFEFLFQKNPFTFFLFSWFCTQWSAGLISTFSISFPLVAPCVQTLRGAAFPQFPCSLTLEFFKLHSSSLWKKLPAFVSLFCLVTLSSTYSLFLYKKEEDLQETGIRFSLITETVFYGAKYRVGKQEHFCLWSGDRWVYLEERVTGRAFGLLGSLPSTGFCSYRQ